MDRGALLVEEVRVVARFDRPILAQSAIGFSFYAFTREQAKTTQILSVFNRLYMVKFLFLVVSKDEFLVDGVLIVKDYCTTVANCYAFIWIRARKDNICAIFFKDSFHLHTITIILSFLLFVVVVERSLAFLSPWVLVMVVVLFFKRKNEP
jgi:hypothetical protein